MTTTQFPASALDAVADTPDGATVLVGGFGLAGMPSELVDALIEQGARDLTIVSNNAGNGEVGLAALLKAGRVRKVICSFPRQSDSYVFDELYRAGKVELELVPQGNLAERMRAAGAGIGAFYCPTAVGTPLACPRNGPRPNHELATIRSPTPLVASKAATATPRRDPDSAASTGISTNQIAANELMPPELAATVVTMPVSANAERF